jgi:hypothetical protein
MFATLVCSSEDEVGVSSPTYPWFPPSMPLVVATPTASLVWTLSPARLLGFGIAASSQSYGDGLGKDLVADEPPPHHRVPRHAACALP